MIKFTPDQPISKGINQDQWKNQNEQVSTKWTKNNKNQLTLYNSNQDQLILTKITQDQPIFKKNQGRSCQINQGHIGATKINQDIFG